jgi:hypothetical protein
MATEATKVDKPEVIKMLAESIGEQVEANRKKSEKVPEVYSSGMRGREKPPHLREKPAKKVDDNAPEERYDENGKRIVTFKAKPRVNQSKQIADLEKKVADLTKKLEGKTAVPPPGKKKTPVKIA